MKRAVEKHPYRFVGAMFLTVLGVYVLAGAVTKRLGLPSETLYYGANATLAVIAVALVTGLGWWRTIGFRRPDRPRVLWLFWLPFLTALANLVGGLRPVDPGRALTFLALALAVGLVEEVFFRGLMLRPLLKRGLWRAVLVSTVLFGLMHSLNVAAGWNALAVALQISYALAIGFGYAALVIRTGVIWPLVLAHALTDLFGYLGANTLTIEAAPSTIEVVISLGVIVIYVVYGVALLSHRHDRAVTMPGK